MIFYIEDDMHMTKSLVILAFERAWEVTEAATRGALSKNVFLEISQNSQENSCARVSFLIKLQVFSCEFCEISNSTFFIGHLRTAASVYIVYPYQILLSATSTSYSSHVHLKYCLIKKFYVVHLA